MNFIVEYNHAGDLAERLLPSLNPLKADTLPLALREVQKTLMACQDIDHAVVFMPVRIVRAGRKVEISDSNGNAVAVDAAVGDIEGRLKPIAAAPLGGPVEPGSVEGK
jgi:hypothetical protein